LKLSTFCLSPKEQVRETSASANRRATNIRGFQSWLFQEFGKTIENLIKQVFGKYLNCQIYSFGLK
jgi:hypothetical protein